MKKMKLCFSILAMISMVACSNKASIDFSENNYDSDPISQITSSGEDNDYDSSYSKEEDVVVPEEYDTFSDNTITAAGKYYLKGEYPSISITAAKDSEVYVFMDGATINCSTGIAFGSSKAIKFYLVLLNDSVNTINNDFLDANSFHIKGEAHISGKGTLNIESKQKNGLKVSKDLYISGSVTLNVIGKNHAITARSLICDGATLNVTSYDKDGLQMEVDSGLTAFDKTQGFVKLINTNLTANCHGDGIQADTYVYISGGTQNIKTECEFVSYSVPNMTLYELEEEDFRFKKSGDTYQRVATDEIRSLDSSYYALSNSAKGIKAGALEIDTDDDGEVDKVLEGDYDIFVDHLANLTINSFDDCIHSNYGDVHLYNCNLVMDSMDDGAHADYNLLVNNASIQINKSYEGLEGAVVTIDGENTNIVSISKDDGINAASDLVTENYIYINNGYFRVYASGDGLDANTGLYLNGGTVIAEGPGSGNGSLDADNIYFNGGIVFACSTNGMREIMTAKQNTFLWQGSTLAASSEISIVDSNNKPLFNYTLKQSCTQIIFSHKDLALQSTYKIMKGSSSVASITMTSSLTLSGSSGGGGHGGGPRP